MGGVSARFADGETVSCVIAVERDKGNAKPDSNNEAARFHADVLSEAAAELVPGNRRFVYAAVDLHTSGMGLFTRSGRNKA